MKALFDIVEAFKIAMGAIVANKARGILTTLGIIIGIQRHAVRVHAKRIVSRCRRNLRVAHAVDHDE
jgi:hypothetical protein